MKVKDVSKFAAFDYINGDQADENIYEVGDIVFRPDTSEIGVVIQVHDMYELRTDMFNNCSVYHIIMATEEHIKKYRYSIMGDVKNFTCYYISDIDYDTDEQNLPEHFYVFLPNNLNLLHKIDAINQHIENETGFLNKGFVCNPKLK